MEDRTILRTYSKTWKFETKIYAIGDFRLPVSINLSQMAYLGVGILLAIIISVIPLLKDIPGIVRFIVIPFATMKFLALYRHDGKNPLSWLKGWIEYMRRPKITVRNQPATLYGEGRVKQVVRNI